MARAVHHARKGAATAGFTIVLYSRSALDGMSRRALSLRAAPAKGLSLLLQIYSSPIAPWLIIEGQPSPSALACYGTLRLEGSFRADRLTTTERRLVMRDLLALSFARVPQSTAHRLIALSPIRQLKRRLTRWLPTRHHPLFRA